MESDRAVPESPGFKQLELLVRNLGDELASFRRRAQVAEARVRTLESALSNGGDELTLDRVRALEAENADLRARLGHAAQRARQLAARVKFIRQQQAKVAGTNGGNSSGVTA